MGQKRIKTVNLSEPKKKSSSGGKKPEKGRRMVKTGKEHGRVTDMSQVMLEEAEKVKKVKQVEKVEEVKKVEKAKPPKVCSHRFKALRKIVKRDKLYSPKEAVKLLKKMANATFDETVELHLVSLDTGVLGKTTLPHKVNKEEKLMIKTEKKFPLAHLKIGEASWPEKKLLENLQAVLSSLTLPRIKKAVLTSTMSPGIKLAVKEEK